jgi:ribosome-interacting GTPase 1
LLAVSAATGTGLEQLRHRLWQLLDVIRVYTKQPGQPADRTNPFILPTGSTVEDVAGEVHRELPEKMRFARLWTSGRPDGQQVRREEVLHDKDVVEIHE